MAEEVAGQAGEASTGEPAGGSPPQDTAHVEEESSGASLEDTKPDGASLDDDDDADEDYSDVPFHEHPRFKALTKRVAKLRRQNSRLRPLAERVKDVDLDATLTRARMAEQLEGVLARNPKLKQQIFDAMSGGEPAAAEPEFNPESLPFNVDDDVGKYFVEQHKTIQALQRQLAAVTGRLQHTDVKSYEDQWRTMTDTAASQLPEATQDLFRDAMYGAYRVALAEGKRPSPQTFVNEYVTKLKARGLISSRTANRTKDAAAQRIAEHNKTLPRQPAGGGSPAPARGDRRETVADVNRRLKQLWRSA